ncbi:MAG: hypothetical protein M3P96_04265 [Actinomycetota bacterium]|nr:hypothetical protein [Actinomycetota bacterium]
MDPTWHVEGQHVEGQLAELRPDDELSLHEVALHYDIPPALLRRWLRSGRLWGYKVPGRHGDEWRVLVGTLHEAGHAPRPRAGETDPQVAELRRALHALADILLAERRRADETDRRLGWAHLEIGRLRGRLRRAGAAGDEGDGRAPHGERRGDPLAARGQR